MEVDDGKALEFQAKAKAWEKAYISPLADALRAYASERKQGKKPAAKAVLLDGTADCVAVSRAVLREVVTSFVQGSGFTATAGKTGAAVSRVTGVDLVNKDQVAAGIILLDLAGTATGAFEITQMLSDRPYKVRDDSGTVTGAKLPLAFELRLTGTSEFLAEAVEFGKIGMPTFAPADMVEPWTSQKSGGAPGQEGGLVHGAGKAMAGVDHNTAPVLYSAVNAAQAVKFRANPVTSSVVAGYDEKAAYGWLFAYYVGKGFDDETASRKAREAARL